MKGSEARSGQYIKWVADRMFKAWDTYGQITKVEDGKATIVTFDDFKETTISIDGESFSDGEIQLSSKIACEDYLDLRKVKLSTRKAEMELEHKKAMREINASIEQLEKLTILS